MFYFLIESEEGLNILLRDGDAMAVPADLRRTAKHSPPEGHNERDD